MPPLRFPCEKTARFVWHSDGIEPRTMLQLIAKGHRRRIELEDKAKVVASDWGTESLPC